MNKLLKTQEQFEQSKKESEAASKTPGSDDFDSLFGNSPSELKDPPSNIPREDRSQLSPVPPQSSQSKKSSQSAPPTQKTSSNGRTPTPPPPPPLRSTQSSSQASRQTQPKGASKSDSLPLDANQKESQSTNSSSASRTENTKSSGSTDPSERRKALDRKGLGPTLEKLIEDAQANVRNRSKSGGSKDSDPTINSNKSTAEKTASDSPSRATDNVANRPASKSPDPSSKPSSLPLPRPESDFSKGMKQAGNYFNDLWTQISKSNTADTPSNNMSSASSSESSASPANSAIRLPDPLQARFVPYLVGLAILVFIGFLYLKYQVRAEQVRQETLLAQSVPRIDEIRTREDLVIAFHSLAKQRLQAAQVWWTRGYVAKQFESRLPQFTSPMQTLSDLYDQARYYPDEHQLTDQQIDTAKSALKQCSG